MDLTEEKILVNQAKKDPEAFGRLFDYYYPQIYGYILKRTGNVAVAEDITSEAFFKALNKINSFKWRGISFSSWIYRIAINEMNSFYRKKKFKMVSLEHELQEKGLELPDFQTPEKDLIEAQDLLEKKEVFIQVQQIASELGLKYQEVLTLRYFEKKKIGEIAEILGKKEGTVKSLLSRAVGQLKAKIDISQTQPFMTSVVIESEVEK